MLATLAQGRNAEKARPQATLALALLAGGGGALAPGFAQTSRAADLKVRKNVSASTR